MTTSLLGWSTFFSTVAESAATLTGLIIVAVSVNLKQILAHNHLPARAAGAIGSLTIVVVMSLAALVPQPVSAFAVELWVGAVFSWIMHLRTARKVFQGHAALRRPLYERILLLGFGQSQVLPLTIGAILLGLGHPTGLYWIAVTIIAAIIVSVINAWVLLVEIVR